uniref:Chromosome 5 open reading frame 34 n=1 Tax=Crocodylus porosus TaxID=8502 RepID=A0A7M4FGP1_CROPO
MEAVALRADGALESHYVDGARLLLAPCGAEYVLERPPPARAHPLQPPDRLRRRSPFALSACREQLLQALDFRNQYSARPYLPSHILPPERKQVLLTDVLEVRWPSPNSLDAAICLDNGSVKISSLDGHAHLYMSELQQDFTVEFLCKASQKPAKSSLFSEKNSKKDEQGKSSQSCISEMSERLRLENKKDECSIVNKSRKPAQSNNYLNQTEGRDEANLSLTSCFSDYVWVTQHWSVSSYPEEWKYPLSLALTFYRLRADSLPSKTHEQDKYSQNKTVESELLKESENCKAISHLPEALPLSCTAPHLHRTSVHLSLSLSLRFIQDSTDIIEIYPGDGSVFKSQGTLLGNYFTHYSIQKGSRQREEKMYSVSSLPPDVPGSPYSINSIITQATRILQYCYKTKLSLTHNYSSCCWNMTKGWETLPVLLDEAVIPNVGRLVAYSDNKVHAVFCDGMTLTMMWDFNFCYGKTQMNQDSTTGWCKLTTHDGTQHLIQINSPGLYERYIRTAVAWCKSVNGERGTPTYAPSPIVEENWYLIIITIIYYSDC